MSDFKVKGNLKVDAKLKLPAEASQRALTVDASGEVTSSSVTSTELGYLSGVTSSIQTQLNDAGTALSDHLSSGSAHQSANIEYDGTGTNYLTSDTNVETALGTLDSEMALRALDADVIKKDGSVAFTADQSMGGNQLTNLGAPVASSDAATKSYVDSVAEGLKPKQAVRVATTANITLSGPQTIDGISAVAGNRVLVKDQSSASQNGIYVVAAGAWSRSTDFDSLTPIDEVNGAMVAVQEGTSNAGKVFVQSGVVATIGTDPINFIFFNSSASLVGGDGITVSGSNISVDHDGQGLTFVATQLALELDGPSLTKTVDGLRVSNLGISSANLENDAVITSKIEDNAVTENKLANGSVGPTKLQDGSVITNKIDDSAVTANKLNTNAFDGVTISGGGGVAASVLPAGVDHDSLLNFVTNKHIDHSAVQIATAANTSGLTGGGNITTTRNLSVDINGTTEDTTPVNTDKLLIQEAGGTLKSMTRANFLSGVPVGSPGDISETSFTMTNNQATPANITGFAFTNATVRSFEALVSVTRDATSDVFEVFTLRGIQKGADWDMSVTSNGDDSGIVFSITTAGQIQYTSTNLSSHISSVCKFRAITLSV